MPRSARLDACTMPRRDESTNRLGRWCLRHLSHGLLPLWTAEREQRGRRDAAARQRRRHGLAVPGRPTVRLRAEGEVRPHQPRRDRRRGAAGHGKPELLRPARRHLDADARIPDEDADVLRPGLPADADRVGRLRLSDPERPGRHRADGPDPAPSPERPGELRADGVRDRRHREPAVHRSLHHHDVHDDAAAARALRIHG